MFRRQTECPDHTAEAMRAFLRIWRFSKIKSIVIEIVSCGRDRLV